MHWGWKAGGCVGALVVLGAVIVVSGPAMQKQKAIDDAGLLQDAQWQPIGQKVLMRQFGNCAVVTNGATVAMACGR